MTKNRAEFIGFGVLVLVCAAFGIGVNALIGLTITANLIFSALSTALLFGAIAVVLCVPFGKRIGDVGWFTLAFMLVHAGSAGTLLVAEFGSVDLFVLAVAALFGLLPGLAGSVTARLLTPKQN